MKCKIAIIGLGNVGMTILYNLFLTKENLDIILIDNHPERANANQIDLSHTLNNSNRVFVGDYKDLDDVDILIIASGIKNLDDRTLFLKNSYKMIREIMYKINKTNFSGNIIVVSNPNDVLTTYVAKMYDLKKVIGTGTSLDTNRMKYYLNLKVKTNNLDINVVGEHGLSQVVLWDEVKFNKKHNLSLEEKKELEEKVKKIANEIVLKKGYTNYGVTACVNKIVDLLINESLEVINLSSYDKEHEIAYSYKSQIIDKKIQKIKDKNSYNELLLESIRKIKKEYNIFNSKIIGIDLDDTITILQEYMLEEASKFDKLIKGTGIIDDSKYLIGEKYGWQEEVKDEFFKNYRIRAIEKAKVRDDCRKYLNKLIEQGYEILIITARSPKYYDNPYEYTKKWLEDNKIPFTKLITDAKSKKDICLKEGVSIFVDDMPKNCLEVKNISNIDVYIMDNKDNILENKDIKRIRNFYELYKEITCKQE